MSTFIPIFINGFGFSPLNSLLLTMPAGAVIGTIELMTPYLAYKFPGWRCYLIFICQIGTIIAAVLLWQLPRTNRGGLLYACYTLASYGGGYAILMGIQTANTAGYTKKSVTASGIFLGYCLGKCCLPLSTGESLTCTKETSLVLLFSSQKMRHNMLQVFGSQQRPPW